MILLPIGHENMTVRRLPWITFGLMAVCVVVHVLLAATGAAGSDKVDADLRTAVEYWFERPYLSLDERATRLIEPAVGAENLAAMRAAAGEPGSAEEAEARLAEQSELDALFEKAWKGVAAHPMFRFGLVPKEMTLLALLTHMFLHGGWLHLIGNLFFLYLAGPFLEDAWGRPLYSLFYPAAGLAAALGFVARYPGLDAPLIGASGAIAGVMGAFLVRFWTRKIEFFYLVGFWWRGTFWAPASLMLPLWLAQQVFYALLMDGVGAEGGGGVAYWAHVFGFAFGAGVALLVRQLRVEERFVAPAIERKTTTKADGDDVMTRAYELRAQGRLEDGLAALREESARSPRNVHVGLAFWVFAVEAGCPQEAAAAMLEVVRQDVREDAREIAVQHWLELSQAVPDVRAEALLLLKLTDMLAERRLRQDAGRAVRGAMLAAGTGMPSALALRIARTARSLDPDLAACAARLALRHADLTPEARAEAEAVIARTEIGVGAESK